MPAAPVRPSVSDDHASLLAAIGRALGQPGPYEETLGEREQAVSLNTMSSAPIGHHREVLGGAEDAATGRVAWVELRSAPPDGGYVPVDIDLRVAWKGRLRAVVEPYTYNPYFGCRVHLARWYGKRFVLIYTEKHKTLLSRFDPPYRVQRSVQLDHRFVVDGDAVFHLDTREGFLRGRVLPAMDETVPLPLPRLGHGQTLWLERPGVARLVALPSVVNGDFEAYDADLARAHEEALVIDLAPARP